MKLLIIFIPFFVFSNLQGEDFNPEDSKKKNQYVMKLLLQEEQGLRERIGSKDRPDWHWRLMKVQMEKYKLIRSKENDKYMRSPIEQRMKKKKKWFFSESEAIYRDIKREGQYLIKKWPNYKKNAEVYYALAVNTLNHNNPVTIQQEVASYLTMALKKSKKRPPLVKKLLASLAEHYYNQKKYNKAVHYYHKLLEKDKGPWITKHLFNLAWCYLQINRSQNALELMKKSLSLSRLKKGKEYIDYSEQIIDALPLFFSRSEKTREGLFFFLKEQENPRPALEKMANYSKDTGKYKEAFFIYEHFLEVAQKKGKKEDIVATMILQLDLFLEFKKSKNFRRTVIELVKINERTPLSGNNKIVVIEKVRRYVGKLQGVFQKLDRNKERVLGAILSYFNYLIQLDPKMANHYSFYQGESLFAVQKYQLALKYYNRGTAFFKKKEKKNKEDYDIAEKSFDAMFASLEKAKLDKKKSLSLSNAIYTNYLSIYPTGAKSASVYQRLFNIHFQQKNIIRCEQILGRYADHYPYRSKNKDIIHPDDHKKQKYMLTQMLNYRIEKKDIKGITYFFKKLRAGYLEFDDAYLDNIFRIKSDIVFENARKQKDPRLAIPAYKKIYKNRGYPGVIRGKAAYYVGHNLVLLLETAGSLSWFKRTLKIMSDKESSKFQEGMLSNIQKMVYAQDFSSAHKLAKEVLRDGRAREVRAIASHKARIKKGAKMPKFFTLKNDFFNASVLYATINGDRRTAHNNFKYAKKCEVDKETQRINLKYMSQFHLNQRNYKDFDLLFSLYKKDKNLQKFFAQSLLSVYWESILRESRKEENHALRHLQKDFLGMFKRESLGKEIAAALKFHQLRYELAKKDIYKFVFHNLPGKFNEKHFNKNLESYLDELKKFTSKISKYINTGYPQVVSYGHYILSRRYQAFGESLLAFRPQGVDPNYSKSILAAMSGLGNQFLGEAKKQRLLGVNLLQKEKILFFNSGSLALQSDHIINMVGHRHPASLYGLTLERTHQKKKGKQ